MGSLFYGAARLEVVFDDRVLAHLQIVITSKLRRHESFLLSWSVDRRDGSGRSFVWIHPNADLHFSYAGARAPAINRQWLDELAELAHLPGGLQVTPEGTLRPER